MSISEKQFKEMIRGTVHEGKYDSKPAILPEEPELPYQHTPPKYRKKKVFSKKQSKRYGIKEDSSENLGKGIAEAIPYMVAIRIATTPIFWLFILLIVASLLGNPLIKSVLSLFMQLI